MKVVNKKQDASEVDFSSAFALYIHQRICPRRSHRREKIIYRLPKLLCLRISSQHLDVRVIMNEHR